MKTPFHRFKNAYCSVEGVGKLDSWSFCEFYGWLGTGMYDRNGVEIFEGDIVQFETFEKETATVLFHDGAFWLGNRQLRELPVICYSTLEVVAHITLEEP